MVISSWLSALTSKFFSKKKVTPRTRNQQSRLAAQATQASEVLESRQMLTVNAIADAYNAGNGFTITEDAVLNVDAGDGVVQSNDDLTNLNGAYTANIVTNTVHGTVTLNADGSFSYDPGDSLQSLGAGETSTETFTYNVTDNDGTSNTVEVVLTVQGVNDDPEAVDDFVTVLEDDVTPVNVLSNDSDVDGDPLILFVGAPQHGTATVNDNGTPNDHSDDFIQYTSELDYTGQDSFTYLLSDGNGGISEATVNVTVLAVNDPPVAADATFNLAENSSVGTVVGTVTATDIDAGDTRTFAITGGNDSGTFVINSTTGQITVANNALLDYESNPIFHLVVTVSDGTDAKDTADITVNLTNVQEPLTLDLPSDPRTFYARHGQTVIDAAASVHGDQLPLFSYANSQLTVQVTGNANKNDRIAIYSEFAGPGNVSLSGSNVLYGNVVIGKITKQGSGTTAMVVKFNENATEAAVNAVLKLVTYKSTVANPPAAQRTITFTLQDATNSQHVSATQFMNVNTSAPQRGIDINGDPVSYYTGGGPVAAAPNALLTGGPAWLDFDGASLSVETRGGSNSTNRLGILETGGITLSGTDVLYNGNKIAVATITNNSIKFKLASLDSTPAAVQALVRAISFYTTASNTNLADREIVFKLTDANTVKSPTVSNTVTLIQSVANAQPTATNTTHSASYTEDGGAQGLGPVIVVADADVGEVITANLTLSNTAAGSLAAAGASYNSGTGVLSITGSVATVNTALASLTFTPAANFNGNFTVGVNIQDGGEAGTDPITGTITVTGIPVNDQISVTNINQSVSFTEDGGAQPIGVAMVVSDVDAGEIVSAWLTLSDPNAGVLSATGAAYNPVTGTLSISGTITAVNTALASLTFTPAANYDGDFTIAVNVQDAGEDGTVPVFGTITVNSVSINDQTTATNVTHSATYTEDAGAQSLGSTIVVADPDLGEVITATLTLSDLNAGVLAATGGSFNGANGTLTITGSVTSVNAALASLTFTPAANYNDNFTIGVNIADGLEDGTVAVTGTITVTGTAVNDQTTATNATHSATYTEDGGSQSLGSTIVVTDVDAGEIVTATLTLSDPSAGALAGTGASYTSGTGVLSITGTVAEVNAALASLTFTPALNYNGSFTIGVNIADGLENGTVAVTGTITVTGTAVNDQTTATNTTQSVGFTEDAGAQSLGSSIVVSDVDAGEIVTATLTLSDTNAGTLAATSGSFDSGTGVLTITGDVATVNAALASLTFTPAANYDQSFTIAVNIADGGEDGTTPVTGTITVTATGLNDQTSATNTTQSASYTEDGGAQALGTTIVVSDVDTGESITATLTLSDTAAGALAGTGASYNAVTGELTITGTVAEVNTALASLTFTPALNYNGNFTVAVDIQDGLENGAVAVTGIITVTGIAVNDSPTADADSFNVDEDDFFNGTLAGSDIDVGDTLTFAIASNPTHGTISNFDSATGDYTYTPDTNYNGSDSFTFTVTDGTATSTAATISITVDPINDAPTATANSFNVDEDDFHNGTLAGSDIDVGDTLTFAIASNPTHGTISNFDSATGDYTYTPDANYNGSDSFTFTVTDGTTTSTAATISITVDPINDTPTATANSFNVDEDDFHNGTLAGSDIDVGDTLTFAIASNPTHGTISNFDSATGDYTYTPDANYNGSDSFTFTVTDGTTTSTAATISITVDPINDTPTATANSFNVDEDDFHNGTLAGSDIDVGDTLTFAIASNPTHGTISNFDSATGDYTYTPDANYNGSDSFTFTVTDGTTTSTAATISITVDPINDTPTATANSFNVDEDDFHNGTLAGSDIDVGDTLTFAIASNPTHGTISNFDSATGDYTYTPDANYNGSDSFTFTVTDGTTTSTAATISITVDPINDTPTATANSFNVDEDDFHNGTLAGSDIDVGDTLTFAIASNPTHGTISNFDSATGDYTYTPDANYNGSDSFTFTVNDGTVTSTAATISITVDPINDAPTATANSFNVDEDDFHNGTLAGSDIDVGDTLTFAIASNPTHGTISNFDSATGDYTYTPDANYNGSDSFTFTVNDGTVTSTAATISITVDPTNDAPTATANSFNVDEDDFHNGTLAGSDIDVGDTLTFAIASNPTHGTISNFDSATGDYTYTPDANYNGSDSFTFTVNDGTVTSTAATISITVDPINDAPTATANSFNVDEDDFHDGILTGSDIDVGDTLTFAIASNPTHGTISNFDPATGEYTYTPDANYNGSDSFTFTVNDGTVTSTAATISITVDPTNDAPTATANSFNVDEDDFHNGTLTGGDIDVGDTLTFAIASNPTHGTISNFDSATGDYTYTPDANYNGSDSFTFTVNDGTVTSTAATISITVDPTNDAPTATANSFNVDEDDFHNGTLAGSDIDVGDTLTFAIASNPTHGTISNFDSATGDYTYTPDANYNGSDSFTFTVNDGTVTSTAATISITVDPTNDAPTATANSFNVDEDDFHNGTLAGSDIDVGDTLTFAIASNPTHGTISNFDSATGDYTYTPDANYNGSDSFTFTVNDGTVTSTAATISITVDPTNDAPTATANSFNVDEDDFHNGTLAGSDIDVGDTLTFAIASNPTHGTISNFDSATGDYTYTPDANYNGSDSFTFTVNDGTVTSTAATISITVDPTNDAPTATANSFNVDEDSFHDGILTGSDIDVGDTLTFAIASNPTHGTISNFDPATGEYTYTPTGGYSGSDSFTFTVNDGTVTSAAATITITVDPIP